MGDKPLILKDSNCLAFFSLRSRVNLLNIINIKLLRSIQLFELLELTLKSLGVKFKQEHFYIASPARERQFCQFEPHPPKLLLSFSLNQKSRNDINRFLLVSHFPLQLVLLLQKFLNPTRHRPLRLNEL